MSSLAKEGQDMTDNTSSHPISDRHVPRGRTKIEVEITSLLNRINQRNRYAEQGDRFGPPDDDVLDALERQIWTAGSRLLRHRKQVRENGWVDKSNRSRTHFIP
jgi:hypothetical protein